MKRVQTIGITLIIALILSTANSSACTGVYVGKDASTDGSILIARSEDQSTGAYNKLFFTVPRIENKPGRTMDDPINGFSLPLPATTFHYTVLQDYTEGDDGPYPASCVNEYGVTVIGTVSASPKEEVLKADPFVEAGLREAVLPAAVDCSVKTAKEGVALLTSIVDKYGSAEGNIVFIGDQKEAWIVEIYSGHQWCAQKMPSDKVAVFGNQFMIGYVDPADTGNVMYSKELFSLADKNGWTTKIDGKVSLAATYGEPLDDYSNMRTWGGHYLLAPSTAGTYDSNKYYDLFYKPDKKVSALDVMNVERFRYEGTPLDVTLPGNADLRVIGVERSSDIHLAQIRDNYPAAISTIQWLCMGNAEHSVFLPALNNITDTNKAYKVDTSSYDPSSAYWKFKRIDALSEQNRKYYGKGARDCWSYYENTMYDRMINTEWNKIADLYQKDPKAAAAYSTKLADTMARQAMDESDQMFNAQLTYIMDYTGHKPGKQMTPFEASVPLRYAADNAGYTLNWAGKDQPLTLTKGNTVYTVTVGSTDYAVKTGTAAETKAAMSQAPTVFNGATFVPLSFVKGLK